MVYCVFVNRKFRMVNRKETFELHKVNYCDNYAGVTFKIRKGSTALLLRRQRTETDVSKTK